MPTITLTNGFVALVDDCDYQELSKYTWTYARRYATTHLNRRTITMGRLLLRPPKGQQVDYINGNRLDNRRENMRVVCSAEQNQNRGKMPGCASRFKGVAWQRKNAKWIAAIRIDGTLHHLGCFDDEIAAAEAYDAKAIEVWGDYARTNQMMGLIP